MRGDFLRTPAEANSAHTGFATMASRSERCIPIVLILKEKSRLQRTKAWFCGLNSGESGTYAVAKYGKSNFKQASWSRQAFQCFELVNINR